MASPARRPVILLLAGTAMEARLGVPDLLMVDIHILPQRGPALPCGSGPLGMRGRLAVAVGAASAQTFHFTLHQALVGLAGRARSRAVAGRAWARFAQL